MYSVCACVRVCVCVEQVHSTTTTVKPIQLSDLLGDHSYQPDLLDDHSYQTCWMVLAVAVTSGCAVRHKPSFYGQTAVVKLV